MKSYLQALQEFNANTKLFLITPICVGVSYYGFFVVLFNLYLLRLGYGPRFIGVISAAGLISFILVSLPAGALAKRLGSRKLIMLGLALYIVGFSIIPCAEFVPASWQTPWLVASYMIAFLGGPFYWVNSNLFLMASTKASHRNHAFSLRSALLPLAGFVGSFMGGVAPAIFAALLGQSSEDTAPYRYALFLAGLIYVPALIAMMRTTEVDRPADTSVSKAVGKIPFALILPIMLVDLLRMAGEVGSWGFFNVFLDEQLGLATFTIGAISGLALLLSGIAALVTPVVADRFGNRSTIMMAMTGMLACLVGLAFSQHWLPAGLSYMGIMALAAISMSALSVYRMELVDAVWWSMMSGAAVTGQGLGEAAVLFSGGFVIASFGFRVYFLAVAALVMLGLVFFRLYFRNTKTLN